MGDDEAQTCFGRADILCGGVMTLRGIQMVQAQYFEVFTRFNSLGGREAEDGILSAVEVGYHCMCQRASSRKEGITRLTTETRLLAADWPPAARP